MVVECNPQCRLLRCGASVAPYTNGSSWITPRSELRRAVTVRISDYVPAVPTTQHLHDSQYIPEVCFSGWSAPEMCSKNDMAQSKTMTKDWVANERIRLMKRRRDRHGILCWNHPALLGNHPIWPRAKEQRWTRNNKVIE